MQNGNFETNSDSKKKGATVTLMIQGIDTQNNVTHDNALFPFNGQVDVREENDVHILLIMSALTSLIDHRTELCWCEKDLGVEECASWSRSKASQMNEHVRDQPELFLTDVM